MNGSIVQRNGRNLEVYVRDLAIEAGLDAIRQYKPKGVKTLFASVLPYEIVGNKGQLAIDVFIRPCDRFPAGLGIEVTEQNASGSGAHKMPHRVETIKQCYPCPGLLVIGKRKGFDPYFAVEWAQLQVDGIRLIDVMELSDYKRFLGLSDCVETKAVSQMDFKEMVD